MLPQATSNRHCPLHGWLAERMALQGAPAPLS